MGTLAVSRGIAPSVRGVAGSTGGGGTGGTPPAAQTDPATGISGTSATLNGAVQNYGTDCIATFEWGKTTAYGNATPPVVVAGATTIQHVSATIANVTPLTVYHVRLKVTNEFGTSYGLDVTFTTGPANGKTGLSALVTGTAPVLSAYAVADVTETSASLLGTVAAAKPGVAGAQSTVGRIGIRRKGVGTGYAYYNQQTKTTSSTAPQLIPDSDGVQSVNLLPDTSYEFVVEGKNLNTGSEWVQSTPFEFRTPAVPPPPGDPPDCHTTGAVALSTTTALVDVDVSHNNTDPLTGDTDIYVRYALASQPTQHTTIGPLNLGGTIVGMTVSTFQTTIPGLSANKSYLAWAYAVNDYGVDDDFANALPFTTPATGAVGTITPNQDANFVGYDQATMRCRYTTPELLGTYEISFGYRESSSGLPFTWTTPEVVPASLTSADWDFVIGGLSPLTNYEFNGKLDDGAIAAYFDIAGYFTTAAAPSSIDTDTPVFPGLGPGTRSGPTGTSGSPPTIQLIPTYRDPRRPSSGLITRDLVPGSADGNGGRLFKSNISAHPTLGPTNKARFSSAGDPDFILTDGVDICIWGTGSAPTVVYPGNSPSAGTLPLANDIEIWNPSICAHFGTSQPPHVIKATTHGQGGNALAYAIRRFARNADLVGVIGTVSEVKFCENTSSGGRAYFEVKSSPGSYYAIVGLGITGVVDENSPRAFQVSAFAGIKWSSQRGCVTNQHTDHVLVRSSGGISNSPFRHGAANSGSNDPSIGYTLNAMGGLIGVYHLNGIAATGARVFWRCLDSNFRYDARYWNSDNTLEHQRYWDNPSATICGVENGVAAPSFVVDCKNRAGTISPTGDGRSSDQIVARRLDNFPGSLYNCPSGCLKCANNASIGPNGDGMVYYLKCEWMTLPPLSAQIGAFNCYGTQGGVHIEECKGNGAIAFIGLSSCNQQLRPVFGPDGEVYATGTVHIESFEFTGTDCATGVITLDSAMKCTVNMAGFTVPAGLASGRYPIEIASSSTSDIYVPPGTSTQYSIRPPGYVKLIGLGAWAAPTSGKKVRFAKDGGSTAFVPPLIEHQYTVAEEAVLEAGCCRAYLHAPLTQPGGHVCPNNV